MASMVDRRDKNRQYRRIQVRFWPHGESSNPSRQVHQGITHNLSFQGAFVSSHKIFSRGTRLRLEVQIDGSTVALEGVVAHAHRVPRELQALRTSGMGVRFLSPAELLSPLLGADAAPEPASPSPAVSERTYPMQFESPKRFLECFHRDLVNGGIFVRSTRPSRMHETVAIELRLPGPEAPAVTARGRVVQVLEPRSTPTGPAAGGMGLELIDLESLLAVLKPIVERLEAGGPKP